MALSLANFGKNLGANNPAAMAANIGDSEDQGLQLFLRTSDIVPNPINTMHFAIDNIEELAMSIMEHGLFDPLTVMGPLDSGLYMLISGERRWTAIKYLEQLCLDDNALAAFIVNGDHENKTGIEDALASIQVYKAKIAKSSRIPCFVKYKNREVDAEEEELALILSNLQTRQIDNKAELYYRTAELYEIKLKKQGYSSSKALSIVTRKMQELGLMGGKLRKNQMLMSITKIEDETLLGYAKDIVASDEGGYVDASKIAQLTPEEQTQVRDVLDKIAAEKPSGTITREDAKQAIATVKPAPEKPSKAEQEKQRKLDEVLDTMDETREEAPIDDVEYNDDDYVEADPDETAPEEVVHVVTSSVNPELKERRTKTANDFYQMLTALSLEGDEVPDYLYNSLKDAYDKLGELLGFGEDSLF